MTSRIFSINLDDVTFAKLGELQKRYPNKSRNAMIRHIIHVVYLLDGDHQELIQHNEALQRQVRLRRYFSDENRFHSMCVGLQNTDPKKFEKIVNGTWVYE